MSGGRRGMQGGGGRRGEWEGGGRGGGWGWGGEEVGGGGASNGGMVGGRGLGREEMGPGLRGVGPGWGGVILIIVAVRGGGRAWPVVGGGVGVFTAAAVGRGGLTSWGSIRCIRLGMR